MNGTTTDKAAQIRATFKKMGFTSRDVSVRAKYFSLGSSIDVVVKSPALPLARAKAVAEQAERIHRCEITGEILGGGNTYVHVRHSEEARQILARRHIAAVEAAIAKIDSDSALYEVEGTGSMVGRGQHAQEISVWHGDRHGMRHWNDKSAPEAIAYEIAVNQAR